MKQCGPLEHKRARRRPRLEVADIFREHGEAVRRDHDLTTEQRKVMRAIETCRTSVLGGHADLCPKCEHVEIGYNSCSDRHCPKCQGLPQARWIAQRQQRVLPTHYFHLVFTLPRELRSLVMRNRRACFDLLFKAERNLEHSRRRPRMARRAARHHGCAPHLDPRAPFSSPPSLHRHRRRSR
ncbi:MAG: hypothetical protein GY719_02040 [bacterium]|nr:hypothetical protein [bacterium]